MQVAKQKPLWDESPEGFRHEALVYSGDDEFVSTVGSFIDIGRSRAEPTLVVVAARKIALLREVLGGDSEGVLFADMADVGHNPARIIPAWQTFVDSHKGAGRLRGVGEPVGPDRGPDELVECERHEDLLNLAFADAPPFWLLCPYDMSVLPQAVVDRARANHPVIARNGRREHSADYWGVESLSQPFTSPLRDAPPDAATFPFFGQLATLRVLVAAEASQAGLPYGRITDLVLAVNEIAANTLQYGGGDGVLRIWHESDRVICEIRDRGQFDNPLADRRLPHPRHVGGRGLWTANHVCDLVQIRTLEQGTVVRLHMSTDGARRSNPYPTGTTTRYP